VSVVFRAADEPAATRNARWRQVLAETIVPMDVRLDDGPTVQDEIITGSLGAVGVVGVSSGPGEARRTRSQIRSSEPDGYQLFVQGRGSVVATQAGREVELLPGDLSLTELSRPFRCVHPARSAVLLRFPRSLLPLPGRDVAKVVNTRIPGDRGTGALVSTLARELPQHLDDDAVDGGARLGTAVLDLFCAALAARLERAAAVPTDTRQRALIERIHAFIEARLADPELSPATVASAHFISLRYLHKLFESEQSTIAGRIRRRRLERCCRDLLDPTLAERPVSAIAARWGLVNPAHFNRLFREAYDLPPGEFRLTYGGTRGRGVHRSAS
jgi:AraC-like DNA-binding protein